MAEGKGSEEAGLTHRLGSGWRPRLPWSREPQAGPVLPSGLGAQAREGALPHRDTSSPAAMLLLRVQNEGVNKPGETF